MGTGGSRTWGCEWSGVSAAVGERGAPERRSPETLQLVLLDVTINWYFLPVSSTSFQWRRSTSWIPRVSLRWPIVISVRVPTTLNTDHDPQSWGVQDFLHSRRFGGLPTVCFKVQVRSGPSARTLPPRAHPEAILPLGKLSSSFLCVYRIKPYTCALKITVISANLPYIT